MKMAIVIAQANRNHLSCWRSIPRDRRNRRARALRQASPHSTMSQNAANTTIAWTSPSGSSVLASTKAAPRSGHSAGAVRAGMSAIGRADSHATGRHRREGRRPLGNSKGTKVSSSPMPGAQTHWAAQIANGPPGTDADRPVVAVRVRAAVGRPGGSAQARWRRMRAVEWAAWTRTLPWRVAVILGMGAAGGVFGSLLAPRLGLILGGLAALVAGWGLGFRPSPDAVAWRRGAAGERRTARLLAALERHGWAVLHDLAIPGSQANIDHLVIGPGGVFVIDSKQYRGRLQFDPSGRLWYARYPLAPTLREVSFEADQAAQVLPDPGVVVLPIVAVQGARVPWGKVVLEGVPVVPARRLPSMLRKLPAVLGPERVAAVASQARIRFRAAA
jgi:Nuclease-related domain